MKRPAFSIAIAVLWGMAFSLPAQAQSTRPAHASPAAIMAAQADRDLENQPLHVSETEAKAIAIRATGSGAVVAKSADVSRIAIALVIVIGMILLLRTLYRHFTSMPGTGRSNKLVTVLSRSVLAPRQAVLVLQVGKRLLVVGDSGGRMNSLCEISDPDEIAMMVGQTRQNRDALLERNPASFTSLFRRANEPFSETEALQSAPAEATAAVDPEEAVSSDEMSGLLDKVRMLQQQFRLNKS